MYNTRSSQVIESSGRNVISGDSAEDDGFMVWLIFTPSAKNK